MNSDKIKRIVRLNPENISKPVGKYSHVTIIRKNSTLYTFSGQIGTDNYGVIPDSMNEQVYNTFRNIAYVKALGLPELKIEVEIWASK